jgi:hypothetical protein
MLSTGGEPRAMLRFDRVVRHDRMARFCASR